MMRFTRFHTIFCALLLLLVGGITVKADTIPTLLGIESADTVTRAVPVRQSLFRKFWDYLSVDHQSAAPSGKLRFNFLGGPFYNTDSKLGVAVMGQATFKLHGSDSIDKLSNSQISFSITTAKFWTVNLKGNVFTPGEKLRLNYLFDISYEPSYFWGIGYEAGNNSANQTMQRKHYVIAKVEGLVKLTDNLHVGPALLYNYMKSDAIERPELLNGQDRILRNYGFGFVAQYDTRDLITDAYNGIFVYLGQSFRPKFLWNHYAFSTTEFQVDWYHPMWKGGVIAAEGRGYFNFGNPSWAMMAQIGDSYHMRGYYRGRYRDKHLLDFQVELRQHLWKRHGITLWLGGGTVFHNAASFKHFLPNYGIGYRFAFRHRMNVRLDLGFDKKGQTGFMFSFNEAF